MSGPGPRSPSALAISGLDPSGGAGLLADVRTMGRYRVHALGVATCLTVQSRRRFTRVHPVDAAVLSEQLALVLRDEEPQAVKIGLLPAAAVADVVADLLGSSRRVPVVLDPVASASAGGWALPPEALANSCARLLPLCALVTPNLHELELLAGTGGIEASARSLLSRGAAAVLVKGRARGPEVEDLLVTPGSTEVLRAPRIAGPEVHGTGCYLSSAIAALLALGRPLEAAVRAATRDLHELRARSDPGPGDGSLARLAIFSA
jgi:hydroxymethylpyrimidine/phosphomethylpyrimidine kinase